MDKRILSKIPREPASADMMETAGRLEGMKHIVTAKLLDDMKMLQLTFYEIRTLRKGKPEAAFRTFLSDSDYITQDLKVSKVKWLTASFDSMDGFDLFKYHWNEKKCDYEYNLLVHIRSDDDTKLMSKFFQKYVKDDDQYAPWTAICRFQTEVKEKRLEARHKKETDKIDEAMAPIGDAPKEFFDWVWETGMSFSRYLIYKEVEKGKALCECTHCGKTGVVDRKEIRLRNNEKGTCPFCGSRVTIKARGKMPAQEFDERWFLYVDPTIEGFILRYFKANRSIRSDSYVDVILDKRRVEQYIHEYKRAIYTFPDGNHKSVSYEWGVYKQRGKPRWCPDNGYICCIDCILYPGNLPKAWEHTPMKYSALEILSAHLPTVSMWYEYGITSYKKYPFLEWLIKMGLNKIAEGVLSGNFSGRTGKLNCSGKTIYQILGLDKVNTRVLQQIDGSYDELRLLQVAQSMGLHMKPEQLREYYEAFGCNTDLLKQVNRKVSLHKLVKYITKESENYPIGDQGECWKYSYMRYKEREDPRIERKRNMAKDWLEYLKWCQALKYDLDNMFIYMPKNFKKVHDRTAKEYQELQDKKAAAEKRRRDALAKKNIEDTKKAMAEIFEKNEDMDAFSIKGKELIMVVPKDATDIRHEGEVLHHCVGGYVNRVAKGETSIFFVRKVDDPETPYFTLEYRDNRVIQCRGSHNCGMPTDVKAFVSVFEKKMQDAALNPGKKNRHRKVS